MSCLVGPPTPPPSRVRYTNCPLGDQKRHPNRRTVICTEVVERDAIVGVNLLQTDVLDAPEDGRLRVAAWRSTAQRQRRPDHGTVNARLSHRRKRLQRCRKQGSHRPQTPPPVLPPGELLQAHAIFSSLYAQGHYVQT